jgi:thiamine biosynthesis lipoprotein
MSAAETFHRRTGRALGAPTSLHMRDISAIEAEAIFVAVEAELARLERIFSLYDPASELSALNNAGQLHNPAPELVALLSLCDTLHRATDGAFDPTIQPLWAHHAGLAVQDRAQDLVGWRNVQFSSERIAFAKPGVQLTLNGIAQGYITDSIAALLRARGLRHVMIDMGEVACIGQKDSEPWRAGVATPKGKVVARISLSDRALATSAPEALILNPATQTSHIVDPGGGQSAQNKLVAISSPSAAVADGFSTAGCLMTKQRLQNAVTHFTDTKLEVFS